MKPNLFRLNLLAQFLKTVPATQFNMDSWRSNGKSHFAPDHALHNCGTTACAIGWACASPQFKSMGLKYKCPKPGAYHDWGCPQYKGHQSWKAVEYFFNLYPSQAHFLFSSEHYGYAEEQPLNDVIQRLEEFIHEHSKT